MNYRPNLQYVREALSSIVERANNLVRPIYQSKAARRGVLTLVYLAGSTNLLADNTSYGKQPNPNPTAPSGQTDSSSGKSKSKNPKTSSEKKGLDSLLKSIDDYFKGAENFGTVDARLYRPLGEGQNRVGEIVEGAYLFPGHCIIAAKDGAYSVSVGLFTEAMDRADAEKKAEQAKKPSKPRKERNRDGLGVLLIPLDLTLDIGGFALGKGVDTVRFAKYVGIVGVEGALEGVGQALKNPADAVAIAGTTYLVVHAASGHGGKGGGVGFTGPKAGYPDAR